MKCKFCTEEIADDAVKCRFCGSILNQVAYEDVKYPYSRKVFAVIGIAFGFYMLVTEVREHNNSLSPSMARILSGERGFGVYSGDSAWENMYYFKLICWSIVIAGGLFQLFRSNPNVRKPNQSPKSGATNSGAEAVDSDRTDAGHGHIHSQNLIKSSNYGGLVSLEFSGEKSLSNDMYKVYLAEKYQVTKNELFGKYIYGGKMYDNLDSLINELHDLELLSSIADEKSRPESDIPTPLGFCPNCDKKIPVSSIECKHCSASFGPGSSWKITPIGRG